MPLVPAAPMAKTLAPNMASELPIEMLSTICPRPCQAQEPTNSRENSKAPVKVPVWSPEDLIVPCWEHALQDLVLIILMALLEIKNLLLTESEVPPEMASMERMALPDLETMILDWSKAQRILSLDPVSDLLLMETIKLQDLALMISTPRLVKDPSSS